MKSLRYITIVLLTVSSIGVATTGTQHLHQIDHNIDTMKHIISKHQQQQSQQQQALKSLETQSAKVALELHKTSREIRKENNKISKLKKKAAQYQEQIANERHRLGNNIKTIYMLGKHSNLQLILEQSDPAKIQRTLTYYKYLNKQHIDEINQLKITLKLAQQTLDNLHKNYLNLSSLKTREQSQLHSIEQLKIKRSHLINKIKHTIHNESQRLHVLLTDKHRLEAEIRRLSTNPLLYQAIGKPFSALRHDLSWPTKGKLIAKYGTKIDKSQLRWKGVLFSSHIDQPVYAVADGKVIFARWLQGYGLLIIIYHGQGYMTLYGRNHYLYKKTGDIVHAGDQIAAVGDSGGHQKPSLYFAIRHNTLPVNPIAWFKHS